MLHMSWDEVDGVMPRAVERGLKRRELQPPRRIGVDETSFQERHEYVTVVYDVERTREIEVLNGRKQEDLKNFFWDTPLEHVLTLESISIDMWPEYINAVSGHVENPELKILFDRFHVAKHLGDGVNKVRTEETGELRPLGDRSLVGSRHLWLQNPENMTAKNKARFDSLRDATFKVARAWAMKDVARGLWSYKSRGWARRGWESLISWMSRSGLGPMVKVAKILRTHLWGIINAIVLKATNAGLESTNAKNQALKKRACG